MGKSSGTGKASASGGSRGGASIEKNALAEMAARGAGSRVYLADLRAKMGGTRDDQDTALKALQQKGKIVLWGLDNPTERTARVESGALHIAGAVRHIAYYTPPRR